MMDKIQVGSKVTASDQKKHVYDYQVAVGADTAPARVVRMVGNNKRVLEVGSGPGAITRILGSINGCKVTALEVDPEAIAIVKSYCDDVISADLNDPSWPLLLNEVAFDRVVAADVLEHVYKPLEVLHGMKSLLAKDGEIIVSLPHIGHAGIAASLLLADFTYRDWGLLDRTHIRFFALKNIDELFRSAGLSILNVEFVVRHPLETEFAPIWTKLPIKTQKAILSVSSTYVYQAVVRAVPSDRGNKGIEVNSADITVPRPSYIDIAKQLTPIPVKRVLKRILKR
jgi:2-polyprenyl-3-methyl-5-hydroxy-6-metoxy-1,4-benzoquinol methylase